MHTVTGFPLESLDLPARASYQLPEGPGESLREAWWLTEEGLLQSECHMGPQKGMEGGMH